MSRNSPQHSSATPEHYTPAWIVDPIRLVLHGIDLDPASCALAQTVVNAGRFFSLSERNENGLELDWNTAHGFPAHQILINPPGSPGGRIVKQFWIKAVNHHIKNPNSIIVFIHFSLEQILSLSKLSVPGPFAFPVIIPAKRIAYDTIGINKDPRSLLRIIKAELGSRAPKDEIKTAYAQRYALELTAGNLIRVPGKNPPHGSFITVIGRDSRTRDGIIDVLELTCQSTQDSDPVIHMPGTIPDMDSLFEFIPDEFINQAAILQPYLEKWLVSGLDKQAKI